MRIELSKLETRGFDVHYDPEEKIIDIYPRIHDKKLVEMLSNRVELHGMYLESVIQKIHNMQIFQEIDK